MKIKNYEKVDILINNAGISNKAKIPTMILNHHKTLAVISTPFYLISFLSK